MKTRCSECGYFDEDNGHFASCPKVRDTPRVQVERIEGRKYSGLLWIDDTDNSTNFKFNIAGGDFGSARKALKRFIAVLQKKLDDESKCPFYKPEHSNCDGGQCKKSTGQVRVLPTGGDSNAILCRDCFYYEIAFRKDRNRDLAVENRFDLPAWSDLKVYGDE